LYPITISLKLRIDIVLYLLNMMHKKALPFGKALNMASNNWENPTT
jgi:hypothetical protein